MKRILTRVVMGVCFFFFITDRKRCDCDNCNSIGKKMVKDVVRPNSHAWKTKKKTGNRERGGKRNLHSDLISLNGRNSVNESMRVCEPRFLRGRRDKRTKWYAHAHIFSHCFRVLFCDREAICVTRMMFCFHLWTCIIRYLRDTVCLFTSWELSNGRVVILFGRSRGWSGMKTEAWMEIRF